MTQLLMTLNDPEMMISYALDSDFSLISREMSGSPAMLLAGGSLEISDCSTVAFGTFPGFPEPSLFILMM